MLALSLLQGTRPIGQLIAMATHNHEEILSRSSDKLTHSHKALVGG